VRRTGRHGKGVTKMKHKRFALGVAAAALWVNKAYPAIRPPVFRDGRAVYVCKSFGGGYYMYEAGWR